MFQGLVEGALLYVLNKKEKPTLRIGQVSRVSNPYVPQGSVYPQAMVVDVIVRFDDGDETIKGLPSLESISEDKNGVIVSDNKDAMAAKVEAMQRTSKQILDSVPYHQEVVDSCEPILRKLNPALEAERTRDEKISRLENKVEAMEGKLDQIVNLLTGTNSKKKDNENHKD